VSDTQKPQPFDELAALAELERLADKIQATRRQRESTVAEFESFVKTFRNDRYSELIAQHEAELQSELRAQARPVRPVGEVAANLAVRPPAALPAPTPPAAAKPPAPSEVIPVPATYKPTTIAVALSPPAVRPADADADQPPLDAAYAPSPIPAWIEPASMAPAKARRSGNAVPMSVAAAAVLVLVFVVWSFSRPSSPEPPATASAPPPAAAAAPAAAAKPSPAPTVPGKALNIELVTLRPVWLRVTVDGARALEAELPPDRRLPFAADKLIQIRAGNGGAVKLMVGGEDRGPLGGEGRVVDRQLVPSPVKP
jgi:hypothetical protein